MSETSNGMPDLATGDNEPSMEDILSSIRKIIADDKSDETLLADDNSDSSEFNEAATSEISNPGGIEEALDLETLEIPSDDYPETAEIVSEAVEQVEIVDTTPAFQEDENLASETLEDHDEILELINFADDEPEQDVDALDLEIDSLIEEHITSRDSELQAETAVDEVIEDTMPAAAFDESLDLVMDSSAADYLSPEIEPQSESEPEPVLEASESLEIEEIDVEPEMESVLAGQDILSESQLSQQGEEPVEPPQLDEDDELSLDALLEEIEAPTESKSEAELEREDSNNILAEIEAEIAADAEREVDTDVPDLSAKIDEQVEAEQAALDETGATNATTDQDMDLVKSLLEDLMDEPDMEGEFIPHPDVEIAAEPETAATDDKQDATDILDDILYQSLGDEDGQAPAEDDASFDDESELAQIARSAQEAAAEPEPEMSDIRPGDKVVLPSREISGKFSLLTAPALALGGAAVASQSMGDDGDRGEATAAEEPEVVEEAAIEPEAKPEEAEIISDDIEEIITATLADDIQSQEEDDMVQAAKKDDSLMDSETEEDTSQAFAALTSVVKEQADLEESGPPIGSLVQEALRPMLKEWLDKNLKGIVERAVSKEVKRISSGK